MPQEQSIEQIMNILMQIVTSQERDSARMDKFIEDQERVQREIHNKIRAIEEILEKQYGQPTTVPANQDQRSIHLQSQNSTIDNVSTIHPALSHSNTIGQLTVQSITDKKSSYEKDIKRKIKEIIELVKQSQRANASLRVNRSMTDNSNHHDQFEAEPIVEDFAEDMISGGQVSPRRVSMVSGNSRRASFNRCQGR
ncbi:hypothetical protein FGO68_gene12924 [Halteria grandinella]|uniref:Uncharacterized protein n=1 Tax=Halteria grandinella TaxID=5974 RepID=A0A8J8NQX3_HALGN|nr:hypothetical protein FGO68_gene12924 [Halteria grandinella]